MTTTVRFLMFRPVDQPSAHYQERSKGFATFLPARGKDEESGDEFQTFQGRIDLDGDGISDIFSFIEGPLNKPIEQQWGLLQFYDARGAWLFRASGHRIDSLVSEIRFGDLNGDGSTDVAILMENGAMKCLENTGKIEEITVEEKPPEAPR